MQHWQWKVKERKWAARFMHDKGLVRRRGMSVKWSCWSVLWLMENCFGKGHCNKYRFGKGLRLRAEVEADGERRNRERGCSSSRHVTQLHRTESCWAARKWESIQNYVIANIDTMWGAIRLWRVLWVRWMDGRIDGRGVRPDTPVGSRMKSGCGIIAWSQERKTERGSNNNSYDRPARPRARHHEQSIGAAIESENVRFVQWQNAH